MGGDRRAGRTNLDIRQFTGFGSGFNVRLLGRRVGQSGYLGIGVFLEFKVSNGMMQNGPGTYTGQIQTQASPAWARRQE